MVTTNPPRAAGARSYRNPSESRRHEHPAVKHAPAGAPPVAANLAASVAATGYVGPATVIEVDEPERRALVQWTRDQQTRRGWARLTSAVSPPLQAGALALVLAQSQHDLYVLGLLDAPAATSATAPAQLTTASGAAVRVARSAGEEVVQLHAKDGALVLEYHPASGKTIVNVAEGDLEFRTEKGNIAFQSARKISLRARRVETQADTVTAKAKNVYQSVEELSQLQAGRTRTLVEGSCHLQARDAFLNAGEDFKIDGKQIHLG
jgi:Protein of unknown function (DUF3540)